MIEPETLPPAERLALAEEMMAVALAEWAKALAAVWETENE